MRVLYGSMVSFLLLTFAVDDMKRPSLQSSGPHQLRGLVGPASAELLALDSGLPSASAAGSRAIRAQSDWVIIGTLLLL